MQQAEILNEFAARSVALRELDQAPSDMLIGCPTLAAILDRPEGSVRQAASTGRLNIPAVKDGRNLRFRLGDVREYIRRGGVAAVGYDSMRGRR